VSPRAGTGAVTPAPPAGDSGSALILVADDVPANVELLFDQLHALGYRTVAAQDGPSTLAAASWYRPDLCILDVSMPAGDLGCEDRATGFEVCRRIKRDPRTARIPVVFVTALNDTTDRVRAIEAGGDDFLTKPHNRLVLGARVRSLLKLKAATDALEDSFRKLRELEKVRDDLLKMIVHDLKTPLTSVLATLELLLDGDFGPLSATQHQVIADADGKAEDLLRLIEDLLEIAKLEETALPLTLEPIAPAALLSEVVHEWAVRFQQEGATATIDAADDATIFEADKPLLKRVLSNLIQNALTHSAHAVTLRLSARRDPVGVLFTVADNGPGIPPEYHELIFQKFEQVQAPHAPRVRSSGLGLAFCRLVIERHGGRIWVQSTEGSGSAFHILLPAQPHTAEHPTVVP
jgi:two-component system sensor histidine kinase/response regulator